MSFSVTDWNRGVAEVLGWELFATIHQKRINKEAYINSFESLFGYKPETGSDITSFCEAVHDVCKHAGYRESKVLEENGRHVFRVVKENKDKANETTAFAVGMKVEFDSKMNVLKYDDVVGHEALESLIRSTFESYKETVSDAKFRQNYKNAIMKKGGTSLRSTGGIYFLLNVDGNEGVKENLKQLFENFGNAELTAIKFGIGQDEARVVYQSVLDEIDEIEHKLLEEMEKKNKRKGGLMSMQETAEDSITKLNGYTKALETALKAEGLVAKAQEKVASLTAIADKLAMQISLKD